MLHHIGRYKNKKKSDMQIVCEKIQPKLEIPFDVSDPGQMYFLIE